MVGIMVSLTLLVSCGSPSFDNIYDNQYFSVEYPSIMQVSESGEADIVIKDIGNISPMLRFSMLSISGMTKGDTTNLYAQYNDISSKAMNCEMKDVKVDGVRSLFVKMAIPGGISGMSIVEIIEYTIPLDGKLLKVELTPQVPDDIELGHRIVETIQFHENH
jgi:hypothetical protein